MRFFAVAEVDMFGTCHRRLGSSRPLSRRLDPAGSAGSAPRRPARRRQRRLADTQLSSDHGRRALGVPVERDRVTLELIEITLPCQPVQSSRFPQSKSPGFVASGDTGSHPIFRREQQIARCDLVSVIVIAVDPDAEVRGAFFVLQPEPFDYVDGDATQCEKEQAP